MANRLRRLVRDKALALIDHVVSGYHRQQMDELHRLRTDIRDLEYCIRRNLMHASEREAAVDSARFARDEMPKARQLPDPRATLEYGLSLAPADGMALEFGVFSGSTLKVIANARGGRQVYGFDSFKGLPEDWRSGFTAGTFNIDTLPDVPGAELVVGLFADTLPGFLVEHAGPVAFVHVDCDLYSSTVTVLEHLGPRLRQGSVIVFDEYFNYPGWREHEHRAWREYAHRAGLRFAYEGYTVDHEQVVVRLVSG
jgi:Methyltransferase domain